jgi:aspartate kinase
MKFGGSSVADSKAIEVTIQRIYDKKADRKFVILSACSGVTDELIKISKLAVDDLNTSLNNIVKLQQRHINIVDELDCIQNKHEIKDKIFLIFKYINEIAEGIHYLNECTPKVHDSMISCGELLSTSIVSYTLSAMGYNNKWLDSRELIKTNSEFNSAKIDFTLTINKLDNLIANDFKTNTVFITQGFIGSDSEGRTTTLGRGGSDYSAAVYGKGFNNAGINVDEIQIWTDVDGVMTADPRIIKNARSIDEMSFEEVLELSFYGAKVLHPDTIKPAIDLNIPVVVLNTFNPDFKGTVIKNDCFYFNKFKSVVPIFGCQSISFTSNNQDELLNISAELNHKLNLLGIKIFLSTISGFVFNIIIKQTDYDINQFIDDNYYEIKNIDLIALVINKNHFTNTIFLQFYQQLSDIQLKAYYGFSPNSILLESEPKMTIEIFKLLHDKLIIKDLIDNNKNGIYI